MASPIIRNKTTRRHYLASGSTLFAPVSTGRTRISTRNIRSFDFRSVHAEVAGGTVERNKEAWCSLCGDRGGWLTCGRCMGEGGFPTRPGLAGVKGKVGWGRCKTCFGQTIVPCLLCGISNITGWQEWAEYGRRHVPQKRPEDDRTKD